MTVDSAETHWKTSIYFTQEPHASRSRAMWYDLASPHARSGRAAFLIVVTITRITLSIFLDSAGIIGPGRG